MLAKYATHVAVTIIISLTLGLCIASPRQTAAQDETGVGNPAPGGENYPEAGPAPVLLPVILSNVQGSLFTAEPNDSIEQAFGPLQSGLLYNGTMSADWDWDFFYFDVTSPGNVAIELTNIDYPTSDYELWVSSNGGPVGSSNTDSTAEKLVFAPLQPGRYYIQVYCSENAQPDRPYYLSIFQYGALQAGDVHGILTANDDPVQGTLITLWLRDPELKYLTHTDVDGEFHFHGVTSLSGSQYFYLFYGGAMNAQHLLGHWFTQNYSGYVAGSTLDVGEIDLSPLELVSPSPSTTTARSFPVKFSWTPRPSRPSESYQVHLGCLSANNEWVTWKSPDLGHAKSYTLPGLPVGFVAGEECAWEVIVSDNQGGYGSSYHSHDIVFAGTSQLAVPSSGMVPWFARQAKDGKVK